MKKKKATASLNLERINGNIYSRTNGTWEDTSDASSSETQSVTGARTQRTKGEVDTELGFGGYDGSKFRLEGNGGITRNRYDQTAQDRLENDLTRLGALTEIAFSPKTNIRIDYEFERVKYTNRTSSDQRDNAKDHAIRAGLSFTPSALITGHATFGVEFRQFDENISTTDNADRDSNNFSADVDLTWEARPAKTKVNVTGASSIENSSTPGQFGFRKWSIGGTLTQGLPFISQNLDLILSSSLERNLFLRASRKDSLLNFGSELKYQSPSKRYPWYASFEFGYERKTTNENKATIEYDNNTFEFLVGMTY